MRPYITTTVENPSVDKADEMLQNLGQRIVDALQGAGKGIREFDDAYAEKVRNFIKLPQGHPDSNTVLGTARNAVGAVAGYPVTYPPAVNTGAPPQGLGEQLTAYGIQYGMPVGGVAIRYGLPIAGVTAAGQGLMALSEQMSSPEREAEMEELKAAALLASQM